VYECVDRWEYGTTANVNTHTHTHTHTHSTYGEKAAKGIGVYVEIVIFFHVPAADFQLGSSSRANVVSALAAAADQGRYVPRTNVLHELVYIGEVEYIRWGPVCA